MSPDPILDEVRQMVDKAYNKIHDYSTEYNRLQWDCKQYIMMHLQDTLEQLDQWERLKKEGRP